MNYDQMKKWFCCTTNIFFNAIIVDILIRLGVIQHLKSIFLNQLIEEFCLTALIRAIQIYQFKEPY